jgi:lysophospholipase L1-like esterase
MGILYLLLLLLAAEFLLRVYHQHTLRRALPLDLRAETRAITWNEIKDKYRIVCLGDSITHGEDLPSGDTYPAMLADMLKERYPHLDTAVVNAGACGHTSVQGLARVDRDVLWYQPHVVFVAFGINDGNLGYWSLDPVRERMVLGERSWQGRIHSALWRSHLYRTLRARARRLLRWLGWQEQPLEVSQNGESQPRVSRHVFEIAHRLLATRIRREGQAALVFMTTTPVTEAFRADLQPSQRQRQLAIYDEYNQVIRNVAAQHGAHLVDVNYVFSNHAHAQLPELLAEDGVHLTRAGNELVASNMLQVLEETGLPGSEAHQRRLKAPPLKGPFRAFKGR